MWVSKFPEKGSVVDTKPPRRHRSVRTEKRSPRMLNAVRKGSRGSIIKQDAGLNMPRRSVSGLLKGLHFHSYKIQVVHSLTNQHFKKNPKSWKLYSWAESVTKRSWNVGQFLFRWIIFLSWRFGQEAEFSLLRGWKSSSTSSVWKVN